MEWLSARITHIRKHWLKYLLALVFLGGVFVGFKLFYPEAQPEQSRSRSASDYWQTVPVPPNQ